MMMSQILRFVDFTKTQKFRYLENETSFFLQIMKFINLLIRGNLFLEPFLFESVIESD